jgi:hypothetical protein
MLEVGQKYSHDDLWGLGYSYITDDKNISIYVKDGLYYVFHNEVLEYEERTAEYAMCALLSYVK